MCRKSHEKVTLNPIRFSFVDPSIHLSLHSSVFAFVFVFVHAQSLKNIFRHSLFLFVVHPLHPQCLEKKGPRFFKDLFSLGRLVDVAGDSDLLARPGAGNTGGGWIVEEVSLGQFFRDGSIKVGNVQDNSLNLFVKEEVQNS